MKHHVFFIWSIILALVSSAFSLEEPYDYASFQKQIEVKIPNSYTPFGNRLDFNRFGDDGSRCVADASGVLTWIDNQGVVRLLPGSGLAIPLFVTNTECLVWNNRFADYDSYTNRAKAEIKLFRAVPGKSDVTSVSVNTEGVEVAPTSPITTTTGSLNFVTFTRKDNGKDAYSAAIGAVDACDMRIYRMSFDGGVQLLKALPILIKGQLNYEVSTVSGPVHDTVSFGSDGSMLVHVGEVYSASNSAYSYYYGDYNGYVDQYYWIDSSGRTELLKLPSTTIGYGYYYDPLTGNWYYNAGTGETFNTITRSVFTSNTRLVYVLDDGKFLEQRRGSSGVIINPNGTSITGVNGTTLDSSSYSKVGTTRYFYTVQTGNPAIIDDPATIGVDETVAEVPQDLTIVRAYRLGDNGVVPQETRKHQLPYAVGPATVVGTVNPKDGSALLYSEDGQSTLWLHSGDGSGGGLPGDDNYDTTGSNVTELKDPTKGLDSGRALPYYVTNEQCVIWENARAPLGGNGAIPPAVVKHIIRDTGTNVLTVKPLYIEGDTLLNVSSYTPEFPYWFLTSAKKTRPDTSLLKNYLLTSPLTTDRDNDGILDAYESLPGDPGYGTYVSLTATGTDRDDPDTDADGRSDGEEVLPFVIIEGDFTWEQAKADAIARGGRLASISSVEESDGIKRLFASQSFYSLWLGGTDAVAEGTWKWVTDASLPRYNPVFPAVTPWAAWAPGQPDNLENSDGLVLQDDFTWADDKVSVLRGYLLALPTSDPNEWDTDGDLLSDLEEIAFKTDPRDWDTNDNGVSDYQEWQKQNDTDKDALSDYDEIYVHLTDPNVVDSDGDGFSDYEEIIAETDPNNDEDFPPFRTTDLFNHPEAAGATEISIDMTYNAIGHRTDTDKVSEDGSVAMRDVNGVIIWVDNLGKSTILPNSSLSKTIYVSNTECVVWQNRYDASYNTRGSISQVVIHRRDANGNIVSSAPISVQGTLLETASLSPATYGFTLVACQTAVSTPEEESTQRYSNWSYDTNTNQNTGYSSYLIRPVDQWDTRTTTAYRITFDGQIQVLTQRDDSVPKNSNNVSSVRLVGGSSDGAMLISMTTARDFYDDVDDADPGIFKSMTESLWISWLPNAEQITSLEDAGLVTEYNPVDEAVYVSNNRIVVETAEINTSSGLPTGNYNIQDIRKRDNGNMDTAITSALPPKDRILPLSPVTRPGFNAFFYSVSNTQDLLSLYEVDGTIKKLGGSITLPSRISMGSSFVRNPRDASLLIRVDGGAGLVWLRSINDADDELIGLRPPVILPSSALARPLLVSATDVVAWMNEGATVDVANGGVVPLAQISHFTIDRNGDLAATQLAPPILGRYVAKGSPLSADAATEGWHIITFEKTAARTAILRSYILRTSATLDADGDGLLDIEELDEGTETTNNDSDGDGILDGQELYPFYIVSGSFTYEQARMDAISRGGWLAVIDTPTKQQVLRRLLGNFAFGQKSWLGGSDMDRPNEPAGTREGLYRWVDESGRFFDENGLPLGSLVDTSNMPWTPGQPNNYDNADGIVLRPDYDWEMAPLTQRFAYIIQYPETDPMDSDSDNDGIDDGTEIANGTNPNVAEPFSGVSVIVANVNGTGNPVDFLNKSIATSYEGLVFDPEQGHVFRQKISVTTKGAFSSSLNGLTSSIKGSVKGTFNSYGYYSGPAPSGLDNAVSIEMQMFRESTGPDSWIILGRIGTYEGEIIGIELRPAKYSKTYSYPSPGALTMTLPLAIAGTEGPRGDGAVTGTISKTGGVALQMYLPDGGRLSYSGPIAMGDLLSVYGISKSTNKSAIIGPIYLASTRSDRDYEGSLRFYAASGVSGSQFPAGFDQSRTVWGSRYSPPPKNYLPITGIPAIAFNAHYKLTGGDFGGITKLGTWAVNNKITIPSSPMDKATVKCTTKTGLLSLKYTLTDATRSLNKAVATGYAVAIQKTAAVSGFYTSSFSNGLFTVIPGDGTIPEITQISPTSKDLRGPGGTYEVQVRTSGAWEIVLPSTATWVQATITSGGVVDPVVPVDPADPADPVVPVVPTVPAPVVLKGSGPGIVKVTVYTNGTWQLRETKIEIAGIQHKIKQDYRD